MTPYLVPVPRCLTNLRTCCKFCRDYYESRILSLIANRIFRLNLHVQTRIGCIRCFSRFVLSSDFFKVRTIKTVFRSMFNSEDPNLRDAAVSLLFKISEKYSYLVILSEFRICNNKEEFVRLCRGKTIERLGPRDPVTCPRTDFCLVHPDHKFKMVALVILRIFVERWTTKTYAVVRELSNNFHVGVRTEAILALSAYSYFLSKLQTL